MPVVSFPITACIDSYVLKCICPLSTRTVPQKDGGPLLCTQMLMVEVAHSHNTHRVEVVGNDAASIDMEDSPVSSRCDPHLMLEWDSEHFGAAAILIDIYISSHSRALVYG